MSDLSLNTGQRDDAPSPRVKGRHPSCEDDEPILIKIKRRDNTGKESLMAAVISAFYLSTIYLCLLREIIMVLLNLPDFMTLIFSVHKNIPDFIKGQMFWMKSVYLIFWCSFNSVD